jgi:hypothetical protein
MAAALARHAADLKHRQIFDGLKGRAMDWSTTGIFIVVGFIAGCLILAYYGV